MRRPFRPRPTPFVAALLATIALAAGALAYFTATGSGSATGTVGTLSAPASPAASASGTAVTVTWSASTISGTVAASSYTVERYSSGGTDLGAASCSPVSSSSGSPDAFGSFTCADSPGGGGYKYKITAKYHSSWTATTGFTSTVNVQYATTTSATGPVGGFTNTAIAAGSISSTLSGGSAATGTITFKVFGPQSSAPTTCTSGGTTVGTATVSGNATYNPSAGFTPSSAGTYWWYASYGGDTNNTASASPCGSGMSSTLVKNTTALTASAPATGNVGTAIAASSIGAALSGATSGATGTITYPVFGPQTTAPTSCTSGGATVGTATVSGNATYNPSAGFTPSSPGTYWWYVSYNGDGSNLASTSTCGTGMASTSVSKANSGLTAGAPSTDPTGTAIGAGSISATLSGVTSGATGTITFTVFGPQASAPTTCTTGGTAVGTATVSGSGTYNPSAGFTPSTAGTYWWYVSYNGDSNNTASSSTCGAGMTSTAVKNGTTLTASGPATDTSGTAIAASAISATLANGTSPTGTITYTVFGPQATAPSTCTSGGTTVGTAAVSGNATYVPSAGFTPSSAGTYWWYASYNGDGSNSSATSTCGSGMASTTVYSVSSAASVTSTAATSTATTSNFTVQPSTTYLLLVFRHSTAGDGISSISSTSLSPSLSTASFTSISSQTYNSVEYQWAYWITTASNASGTGSLTVNFTNTLGSGQVTVIDLIALGGNDTSNPIVVGNVATTNGNSGSVTANLPYAPSSVDSGLVFLSDSKGLGSSTPAASPAMTNLFYSQQGPGSVGVYNATPGSQNESYTVTSAAWGTIAMEIRRAGSTNSPSVTVGAPTTGSAGGTISTGSLSATLSGATSGATGGVTYTVFGPQASAPTNCTTGGTTVGSTVTVSGNGTYNPSAGFTPATAGTYWWYASYGGDADNLPATSTCGSGMTSTVVGAGSPTITAAGPSAALAGTAIAASSITSSLSSGASPTGTITYKVFGPQASAPTTCTSGGTTVGTSSVSGNGSYSSSAGYTPSSAGTYWWYASYGGDPNNNASTSTCGAGMPATYVYGATSVASVADTAQTNNSTTSTFTVQPSTTYLLLVYRSKSGAGDGLTSLSSTNLSPALTLSSFTSITSQSFNSKDYQWAYWITTASNASGTGSLTLNFTNTLGSGQVTLIDVIELGGVSTTAPVLTSNEVTSTANSGTATANLPNALAAGDIGLVFLSGEKGMGASAPTASPSMTNVFYSQQGPGSMSNYVAAPGVQNESFAFGGMFWGTIGFELTHP